MVAQCRLFGLPAIFGYQFHSRILVKPEQTARTHQTPAQSLVPRGVSLTMLCKRIAPFTLT